MTTGATARAKRFHGLPSRGGRALYRFLVQVDVYAGKGPVAPQHGGHIRGA